MENLPANACRLALTPSPRVQVVLKQSCCNSDSTSGTDEISRLVFGVIKQREEEDPLLFVMVGSAPR